MRRTPERAAEANRLATEAVRLGLPATADPALIEVTKMMNATPPAVRIIKAHVAPAESEPEPDLGDVQHAWSKNDLVKYILAPLIAKVHERIGTPLHARIISLEAENKALKGALAELQTKALRIDERIARHSEHLSRLETKQQASRR